MRSEPTKKQRLAEIRYRGRLRARGFRSWRAANKRRSFLIDKSIRRGSLPIEEYVELESLQQLADAYVTWKTNDSLGRSSRRAGRMLKRLEATRGI